MTTYLKIEGTLTGGRRTPRMNLGVGGASFALTPQGITAAGSTVSWVDEISDQVITGGPNCSIGPNGGVYVSGGGAGGGIPIPFGLVSDNFTMLAVLKVGGGTAYLGDVGQYKIGTASGSGGMFWVERTGVSRIAVVGGQTTQQVLVMRCQGSASRVISGGSTQQDHTITAATRAAFASQWLGSSNTSGNEWSTFAMWPSALSNAHMDAILAQNLTNFPAAAR